MSDEPSVNMAQIGAVVTLTLNRPEQLNALDTKMASLLLDKIEITSKNTSARLVILRAEGRSFCAGGDVAAMYANRNNIATFIENTINPFHACVLGLQRLRLPVIASVQGPVAGGGFSLAMACDLVVATRSARFVVAYSKLGAPADGGLSFFLVQRLGNARALDALTTGGQFTSEQALQRGLINRVVDDDRLQEETNAWGTQLLTLTDQSLRELKGLVTAQSIPALEAHLAREKAAFLRCAVTTDFQTRVASFAKKQSI